MEDKECIIAEKQKSKRNDLLLTAILKAGPGEAFAVFLDALKPNHINVWKTIDDKLTSDSRKLYNADSGAKQDLKQRKIKSNVNLSEITVLLFGINESKRRRICYQSHNERETYEKHFRSVTGNNVFF
ncbi:hypothetical protein Bpfe_003217 [Biomphalaria pfeifferi]|uniref:CARD domain-containing protein n=1 Tax=Biomphalaria pfeifferi TaxID=112525 RepID=A0AAD8C7R4_BIOPF|nr:hypothetical protein Bpfe_003217 [Biomphalaria pfeifferi]